MGIKVHYEVFVCRHTLHIASTCVRKQYGTKPIYVWEKFGTLSLSRRNKCHASIGLLDSTCLSFNILALFGVCFRLATPCIRVLRALLRLYPIYASISFPCACHIRPTSSYAYLKTPTHIPNQTYTHTYIHTWYWNIFYAVNNISLFAAFQNIPMPIFFLTLVINIFCSARIFVVRF